MDAPPDKLLGPQPSPGNGFLGSALICGQSIVVISSWPHCLLPCASLDVFKQWLILVPASHKSASGARGEGEERIGRLQRAEHIFFCAHLHSPSWDLEAHFDKKAIFFERGECKLIVHQT